MHKHISLTFALSLMDPFPKTAILTPEVACKSLIVAPEGPTILPTKFAYSIWNMYRYILKYITEQRLHAIYIHTHTVQLSSWLNAHYQQLRSFWNFRRFLCDRFSHFWHAALAWLSASVLNVFVVFTFGFFLCGFVHVFCFEAHFMVHWFLLSSTFGCLSSFVH